MASSWSTRFVDSDRGEWIGSEDPGNPDIPPRGTKGTVISIDPLDGWVVAWDSPWATAVHPEKDLRKVAEPQQDPGYEK